MLNIVQYGLTTGLVSLISVLPVNADSTLVYKLALTTTGEFGAQFASSAEQSQAIDELVLRANRILTRDLGIKLVLVSNNDDLLHTDPSTDPFTNNADKFQLLEEGSQFIESVMDPSLYQLGHTIGFEFFGGVANTAFPCDVNDKAAGVSDLLFYFDDTGFVLEEGGEHLFIHELGHQLGAGHTFNSVIADCGLERFAQTAVEPGAGSTIMSYAGLCESDSFVGAADPYFHIVSIDEILDWRGAVDTSCLAMESNDDVTPSVEVAQTATIPKQTPLLLLGKSALNQTPVSDILYSWEQVDPGEGAPYVDPDNGLNPLFRSRPPSLLPHRYLPDFKDLSQGVERSEEQLPITNRTITMQVSARNEVGGISSNEQVFNVDAAAGPFTVSFPSDGELAVNTVEVIWDVAGTASEMFGAEHVDIFLSLHNGALQDFVTPLALRTPNDGEEVVSIPSIRNGRAQIIVKASDNAFFNVSPGTFVLNGLGDEICPATDIVEHVAQDWESGSLADWEATAVTGTVNWEIGTRNADNGTFHVEIENTAIQDTASWPDVPFSANKLIDARLTMRTDVVVGRNVILEVRHAKNYIDKYSAGLFELSTNGGESWRSVEEAVSAMQGGYDSRVSVGFVDAATPEIIALFDKLSFGVPQSTNSAALSSDYQYSRYDMSVFAGRSVRFRFRFLSSGIGDFFSFGNEYGWDIDAVRLISCVSEPRLFVPALTYDAFDTGFEVAWADNGTSVGNWSLRVGTSNGADDLFDGSPSTNDERLITVQNAFTSLTNDAYFTLVYVDLADGLTKTVQWSDTVSPTFTIPNNQWVQIGTLSLSEPVSLVNMFAGQLEGEDYGTTWQVFEYVQGASASGYRIPDPNEVLVAGRAYWMIQITGETIVLALEGRLPSAVNTASLDCPPGTRCIVDNFPIVTADETYWIMVSNPYRIPILVDDVFVGLEVNGQREVVPIDTQASQFTHTASLFTYSPTNGGYGLQSAGAQLAPMQGGWVGVNTANMPVSSPRFFAGFHAN